MAYEKFNHWDQTLSKGHRGLVFSLTYVVRALLIGSWQAHNVATLLGPGERMQFVRLRGPDK